MRQNKSRQRYPSAPGGASPGGQTAGDTRNWRHYTLNSCTPCAAARQQRKANANLSQFFSASPVGESSMPVLEIRHPLIRHKLGLMRRADISTKNFRELAQEVGALLTYEATKDLPLENCEIEGWCGTVQVEKISGKKITVVPILRAGIGMLEGVLSLIPGAKVSAVGVARNEETLQAHTYLEKLVPEIDERLAMIIDPMLATGGSMVATIDLLKKAGCKEIRAMVLVAAPEGIKVVNDAHPDVLIFTASIDERLNEHGYIIPGLGDAGDKIFGTKQKDA